MSESDQTDDAPACDEHGVDKLPTGYDECPYCKQERNRRALQVERAIRRSDERMHPTVDAPRR